MTRIISGIVKNKQKINIMITGATGSGKSSTINALFGKEMAKVGVGVNPETMIIERYEGDTITFWDTPGLGDGKEADKLYARNIIDKLNEVDTDGKALIDAVLVVIDGSTRDLGTVYELINKIIIPNCGEEMKSRILIAVNQADIAMKGRNWDYEKNEPEEVLKKYLKYKVESIKARVKEATGVEVTPICYSAGYKEEEGKQCEPYNLSKLLCYIEENIPRQRRDIYIERSDGVEEKKEVHYSGSSYREKDFFETVEEIGEAVIDFVFDTVGELFWWI